MKRLAALGLLPLIGLFSCASDARRKYETERAPEFLFEKRQPDSACLEKSGTSSMEVTSYLRAGRQPRSTRTRLDEFNIPRKEAPALTLAPDIYTQVRVQGGDRTDWSVHFCAVGSGQNDAESEKHLQQMSVSRVGAMVASHHANPFGSEFHSSSSVDVEAPKDAPVVVNASYSYVEVLDMASPVRVSASHARAKVVDTSGDVHAYALVVDFAGASGHVVLTAEAEVNVKVKAKRFSGTLLVTAQRTVRVLLPPDSQTSFEAIVNRSKDFVCRADICAQVKQEKKEGHYVFSFTGNDPSGQPLMRLQSEQGTIVIDTSTQ